MIKDRDLKTIRNSDFKKEIDGLLRTLLEDFYKNVEGGDYLISNSSINKEYYKRHVIEIILRLRMKRWIDALTIHYFAKHNPFLAKKWAQYTEDEMLHDEMFARDLEVIGVTKDEIYLTEPLFTTKILQGYFYYGIEHEGCPLASLCSSYFIEQMSLVTQPKWIDNIESQIGEGMAKGQRAHVNHDIEDNHTEFVWNVLSTFVGSEEDENKVRQHIVNVYTLLSAFYTELYKITVCRDSSRKDIISHLASI